MIQHRVIHCRRRTVLFGIVLLTGCPTLLAQTGPSDPPPEAVQGATEPAREKEEAPPPKAASRTSRAWGARLDTEPPGYVRTLDQSGISGLEELDWLEFGLEQRTRFEYRSDIRRPDRTDDEQFLLRSRVYLGVRKILDPFRFGIEFQDARQFHSDHAERTRDVDEADFLQAFGELYFEDALGEGYPVQFRAGRMTLEYVDRRLIGRNRWRNTINSFDGFRLRLGQPAAAWQFDFFAVQPVERRMSAPDRADEDRWFYGLVGAWRSWSDYVTVEPYYFILDEDRKDREQTDREIHTLGLHLFGPVARTRFDYDVNGAFQFGDDGERRQRAFALYGELGYTFEHAWQPRLSLSSLYASGDGDPSDRLSERFDRLFEVTHPYSTTDLFAWQNAISPEIRLSMKPTSRLSVDTSYGVHWLARDSDAWVNAGLRDADGDSGDFIGQEVELRLRYRLHRRIELEAGYAHFFPGPFARNSGPTDDGDLFYVQTTIRF